MGNTRNTHRRRKPFFKQAVIISSIVLLFSIMRWGLIPWELQQYDAVQKSHKVAYLILKNQQNLHHKLLAQLTYVDANGQWQTIDIKQQGNAAILAVAYFDLPGFDLPGEHSGIKLVGIDLQQITTTASNDPLELSNNAVPLNGGTDGFFNFAQTTHLPLTAANLYMYPVPIISDFATHCYNIYATTEPTFELSTQVAPGPCITPSQFTQSLP